MSARCCPRSSSRDPTSPRSDTPYSLHAGELALLSTDKRAATVSSVEKTTVHSRLSSNLRATACLPTTCLTTTALPSAGAHARPRPVHAAARPAEGHHGRRRPGPQVGARPLAGRPVGAAAFRRAASHRALPGMGGSGDGWGAGRGMCLDRVKEAKYVTYLYLASASLPPAARTPAAAAAPAPPPR